MRRREFTSGAVAALLWSQGVCAQSRKQPLIGIHLGTSYNDSEQQGLVSNFLEELVRLGWVDGRTARIEQRWGEGDNARIKTNIAELAALAPDIIFAQGTPLVTELRRTPSTVPIVFVNVADPIASGFAQSFNRPGGNATGFTNYELSIASKWLELLREVTPSLASVLIVTNPDNVVGSRLADEVGRVAHSVGLQSQTIQIRSRADVERRFDVSPPGPNVGIVVIPDFVTTAHRDAIIERANRARAPSVFPFRSSAMSGGLLAYSIDQADTFRKAAGYVDRILRGAKTAELPIQGPDEFQLIINLKTAKTLGLAIPTTLLARADEVIE